MLNVFSFQNWILFPTNSCPRFFDASPFSTGWLPLCPIDLSNTKVPYCFGKLCLETLFVKFASGWDVPCGGCNQVSLTAAATAVTSFFNVVSSGVISRAVPVIVHFIWREVKLSRSFPKEE